MPGQTTTAKGFMVCRTCGATLLYDSGVDPLAAMRMVGHRDCQTTVNIYTRLKAAADMATVFKKRRTPSRSQKAVGGNIWAERS